MHRDARGVIVGQVPRGSSGVVGQTPLLVPGSLTRSTFEYFSSALLDTPTGSMDVRDLNPQSHLVF